MLEDKDNKQVNTWTKALKYMNETKKINKRFTGEIVTIIDLEPNHEDDIPDEPVGNAIKIIADLISSCC